MRPTSVPYHFRFVPRAPNELALPLQLLAACGLAAVSSLVGLKWGRWMTRVRR
jgi:hypothetical protein